MNRLFLRLTIQLLVPLAIALSIFLYLRSYLMVPVDVQENAQIDIDIVDNMSLAELSGLLHRVGVVKAPWVVKILMSIKPDSASIKTGEYRISKAMTPRSILEKLHSGDVIKRPLEIKPGDNIYAVAAAFESAGIRNSEVVLAELTNNDLLVRAGIKNTSFEGYLQPGQYEFSKTEGMPQIIWKIAKITDNPWQSLISSADAIGLSMHEVLTIASLIQAETADVKQQTKLSGVYHNRLTNLMRLESAAALNYGARLLGIQENEKPDYQDAKNLYNTFVHYGLPPGPICNPGESAISAALNFETHQYLFALPIGNGEFLFAETLNEYLEHKRDLEKSQN